MTTSHGGKTETEGLTERQRRGIRFEVGGGRRRTLFRGITEPSEIQRKEDSGGSQRGSSFDVRES